MASKPESYHVSLQTVDPKIRRKWWSAQLAVETDQEFGKKKKRQKKKDGYVTSFRLYIRECINIQCG